jgi:hypothetical protein
MSVFAPRNFEEQRISWWIIERSCWRHGMTSSRVDMEIPNAEGLSVTDDSLSVDLSDGRTVTVPLTWFPRLLHGAPAERERWRLIGRGEGIHWEALDEDISVESLLAGKPSGESQDSLKKWLEKRKAGN